MSGRTKEDADGALRRRIKRAESNPALYSDQLSEYYEALRALHADEPGALEQALRVAGVVRREGA